MTHTQSKQIDGAQRTIWAELFFLPDQIHSCYRSNKRGWAFCFKIQTPKEEGEVGGAGNIEKQMTPRPTDARCIWERKKFPIQASTKQGSEPAGQEPKCPSIAHCEAGDCHGSIKGTQAS